MPFSFNNGRFVALLDDGAPLIGGQLFTYQSGTSTPQATYTDATLGTPNTNPVDLDARGEAPVWLGPNAYSFTLKDSTGVTIWTIDGVQDPIAASQAIFATLAQTSGAGQIGYDASYVAYAAGTVGAQLAMTPNIMSVIPVAMRAAILARTSTADLTAYLNTALAQPFCWTVTSGVYTHNSTLNVPKAAAGLRLAGHSDSYDGSSGAVFKYTGTGIAFQIGVDDGSPDSTGPIRGVEVEHVTFETTTGAHGVVFQNTALCSLVNSSVHGFKGKCVWLKANVLAKVHDNDVRGDGSITDGSNFGIYFDEEYFGNFVTDIRGNHIYQINWGCRFSEGRSISIHENHFENIQGWTSGHDNLGGLFLYATSGYMDIDFYDNYSESTRGWMHFSDPANPFTGNIEMLSDHLSRYWGSGDASNPNPGFGNLPRNKVMNHDISEVFVPDASWNTNGFLGLPSVFPSTSIFDQTTTIIRSPITGKEYEDDLVYNLRGTDQLGQAGEFTSVTGATTTTATGGALALTGAGATPAFWTNLASPQWQLILDSITGGWCCYVPNTAADFDRCSFAVALAAINRVRYFAIAFTTKGWSALSVNGSSVYDSGASKANWHTEVVKFSVAANATSIALKFGTNANQAFYIGEARLFEIGVAEYSVPGPGALGGALTNAVRRLMKRGAY